MRKLSQTDLQLCIDILGETRTLLGVSDLFVCRAIESATTYRILEGAPEEKARAMERYLVKWVSGMIKPHYILETWLGDQGYHYAINKKGKVRPKLIALAPVRKKWVKWMIGELKKEQKEKGWA